MLHLPDGIHRETWNHRCQLSIALRCLRNVLTTSSQSCADVAAPSLGQQQCLCSSSSWTSFLIPWGANVRRSGLCGSTIANLDYVWGSRGTPTWHDRHCQRHCLSTERCPCPLQSSSLAGTCCWLLERLLHRCDAKQLASLQGVRGATFCCAVCAAVVAPPQSILRRHHHWPCYIANLAWCCCPWCVDCAYSSQRPSSHSVQNTPCSDHFWKLRCRKSARRCGAKHISKSKCTKHTMYGPFLEAFLEVQMSKKCTPLWCEAHFEVKMLKTPGVRTIFGGSDVASLRFTKLHYKYNYTTTFHYTPLHSATLNYTTLHYTTLHYTPLHYITLHYTPQHYNYNYTPLHSATLHYTKLHYTTLHYTPLHYITLHYTTFHYTSLHYSTLHSTTLQLQLHNYTPLRSITLHYITLHNITLHYTTPPSTTLRYTPLH